VVTQLQQYIFVILVSIYLGAFHYITKNIKNEPFVGAHFFAFDVRSARISPLRPFAKRSAGPAD